MRNLVWQLLLMIIALPLTVSGVVAVGYWQPALLSEILHRAGVQSASTSQEPIQKQLVVTDIGQDLASTELDTAENPTYLTTTNTYVTNPTTETTIQFDGVDLDKKLLLYVNDEGELATITTGASGQILRSNGSGSIPDWVDLSTVSVDWASPGAIGGTSPNTAVFTSATFRGGSTPLTVGSGSTFKVLNSGRLELSYSGDSGYLSSSGGVIFIDNSDNIGTGIGIYSNAAGNALGNMINVKVDNPLYNQAAFYMNYDGLSNAVEIVSNSSDTSSNALAVTGNNINDSTLGIIGYELAKGTIKITHNRPGSGTDSSASALSIDLKGSGTLAQGVYVDSTESGGTLGNLLRLRNQSIDKFVVNYQGNLTTAGNITQGSNGTDTTFTKYGTVAGDEFFIGTNAAGRFQRSASNSEVFRAQIAGDANGRWVGTSDGRLRWGDGTNATDVTLRRISAGILGLEGGIILNNLNANYDSVVKGLTDSNLFFVDASANNIGIGTSSPTSKLDLEGDLQLNNNDLLSANAISISDPGPGEGLLFGTTTANWRIDVSPLDRSNADGNLNLHGSANNIALWRPSLWVYDSTNYTTATAQSSGGLNFTSTGTGHITFNPGGNVGIGTTNPGAPLHVFGGDIWLENNQALRIKDSGGSARSVLAYTSGNNVQLYNYASTGVLQIGLNNVSNTAGNIRFFTNNNQERVRIDPAGLGVGATSFGTSSVNVLAIANSTAPSTSITDGIQLFAVDEGGSHELRVRDEAGNVTTLSPHNFSSLPNGISEPMAWSYYSERNGMAISADMTKALRLVEGLSGVQLVYVKDLKTGEYLDDQPVATTVQTTTLDELKNYVSLESLKSLVSWNDQAWSFLSSVVFKAQATFERTVIFLADVKIFGRVTVGKDTAGKVTIPTGATSIVVKFSKPYQTEPLVYVTPVGESLKVFSVDQITTESFVINLESPSDREVVFNWLAVIGEVNQSTVEVKYPNPSVSPTPTAIPIPEVAGVATGEAEISNIEYQASSSAESSAATTLDLVK